MRFNFRYNDGPREIIDRPKKGTPDHKALTRKVKYRLFGKA